jgi:hypothetical protein
LYSYYLCVCVWQMAHCEEGRGQMIFTSVAATP